MPLFALFEGQNLAYRIVFFLHVLFVIVGFGSSFVWPALAARARKLDDPAQRYAITHASYQLGKPLTTYPIIVAGLLGIAMIPLSKGDLAEAAVKFSDTWVSIAFLLYLIALAIALALHAPNLSAMDELGGKLSRGEVTPQPGGPPAEVVEIQERAKKAAMYGGILHLLFALLLLDMVFKPGIAM